MDSFSYFNENYDWTNEMPYFWFSFFKIDGTTCKLDESLKIKGKPVIYNNFKKFENVNNFEPDRQDIIKIPAYLGQKELTLEPIPSPNFMMKTKLNAESYLGCIAFMMNEECAASDLNNNYIKILKTLIQNSLDELVQILHMNQKTVFDHLENLKENIESKIISESRKEQSFWKRLTNNVMLDTTIWFFSAEELKKLQSVSLEKFWGTEGRWTLSGKIKVNESYKPRLKKISGKKVTTD